MKTTIIAISVLSVFLICVITLITIVIVSVSIYLQYKTYATSNETVGQTQASQQLQKSLESLEKPCFNGVGLAINNCNQSHDCSRDNDTLVMSNRFDIPGETPTDPYRLEDLLHVFVLSNALLVGDA